MIHLGAKPLADFNEPIEMMKDCHRRIEHFLDVLRTVELRFGQGVLDDEGRRALLAALNYFANSAPRHTADEEQSLFPRMRHRSDADARAVLADIDRLEHDHVRCEACHAFVDQIVHQWLEVGQLDGVQQHRLRTVLDELAMIYAGHIHIEETRVFAIASHVLNAGQLQEIGDEMRARRSLTKVETAPADPLKQ
jgi:hemerythrin-like domain-containing protein